MELHLLDREVRPGDLGNFPVRWTISGGSGETAILRSCTITGKDAEELIGIFKQAFTFEPDMTLCGHYPNYGLRVFEGGSLLLETTVCLSCSNWVGFLAGRWDRFRIAHAATLSAALQRLLPP